MKRTRLLVSAVLLALPLTAFSADLPWYAGASGGLASLRPETQNSPFTLDSAVSIGGGAFVGYDIGQRLSVELGFNYLGSATLSGANGKTDIGYTAISAGGLMYLYGNTQEIADRNGFAGFLRLGLSSMSNSASIPLERKDNVAIWAGIGVEWPFTDNMSLRGELTSFDGDAQTARVSIVYRPRNYTQSSSLVRDPQSHQTLMPVSPNPSQKINSQTQTVINEQPAEAPATSSSEQPLTWLSKKPETSTDYSHCAEPVANEPVDEQGCALFSGTVPGLGFLAGTANLTPTGAQQLVQLSDNLLRYPSVLIEIQAHTASFGSASRAKEISRQRAIAVARYLAKRGVPVRRLRARAFGHSRPLASDDNEAGRQKNNRIELRVLP